MSYSQVPLQSHENTSNENRTSNGSSELEASKLPESDPNLVTWNGPDDPANPLNWSRSRKWLSTLLVSSFTFISPVSSTMVSPALSTIATEFGIKSDIEQYLVMSIFLLAYALGPFVLAPLSEIRGRVGVLQSANLVYLIFNTVCGFSQSKEQILAFRFLSGLGASAPQAIGGGVLHDCWRADERGTATAIYSVAPFLGPAVAPIAGGYLTQYMSWRWVFWIVSMADALVQILAFLFLRETYAPKILADRKKKLIRQSGNNLLRTEYDCPDRTLGQVVRKNFIRPFRMLFTEPAIQALALYRAYQYGLMYLVLASFPMVWEGVYGEDKGTGSLNYISLGVGFIIGLQFCGRVLDMVYKSLKRHQNEPGRPEFRIPLMVPGGLLVPIGLFLYGWSAEYKLHWIVPNIGAAIFAIGLIICFQCCQTYVIDAYGRYSASASGVAAFLRTLAGFAFPLFAKDMYDVLGLGWGNSLLGFVSLGLGIVAPVLLWFYGAWLRRKSPYCSA